MNVQIVNGTGKTATANGVGNLILGYNESPGEQTGSHNLVLGRHQSFTSYGGIVAGTGNRISGPFASITGGAHNVAAGRISSISGGNDNKALGYLTSVAGGTSNTASGAGGRPRDATGRLVPRCQRPVLQSRGRGGPRWQ